MILHCHLMKNNQVNDLALSAFEEFFFFYDDKCGIFLAINPPKKRGTIFFCEKRALFGTSMQEKMAK